MAEVSIDDTTLYQFHREVTDTTWVIQGSTSRKENNVGDPMNQDKMAAKRNDIFSGLVKTMARLAGRTCQGCASGGEHPAVSGAKKSLAQELHTLTRVEKTKQTPTKGHEGINIVGRELQWLPAGYHVINDLTIPTPSGSTQIDYVVIGPTGLYCIEADHSAGRFDPHQDNWIRHLYDSYFGSHDFPGIRKAVDGPQKQSIYHADCLTACLKGRGFDIAAKPLVVLTNDQGEWMGAHGAGECPVIRVRDLRDHIRHAPQNQAYDQDRAARILSLSTEPVRFRKAMQH